MLRPSGMHINDMEELIKYFDAIEKRLAKLEEANQAEPEQERKIAELSNRLHEMSALVAALSAKNLQLETKIAALEARPAQVVEKIVEVAVPAAAPAAVSESVAESEEVKLDEETGLPELEVELVEESAAESEEVKLDEETGLPELEVELIEEPETEAAAPVAPAEEPAAEPAQEEAPKTILDAAQTEAVSSVVPRLEDIRKGITMGDRFLFQRELFGNNAELYSKTIDTLNKMNSMDEAMAFIQKNFGGWNKESNAYELFINLLKRRF